MAGREQPDPAVELLRGLGFEGRGRVDVWILRLPDGRHHAVSLVPKCVVSLRYSRDEMAARLPSLLGLAPGQTVQDVGFRESEESGRNLVRPAPYHVDSLGWFQDEACLSIQVTRDDLPTILEAALGPITGEYRVVVPPTRLPPPPPRPPRPQQATLRL